MGLASFIHSIPWRQMMHIPTSSKSFLQLLKVDEWIATLRVHLPKQHNCQPSDPAMAILAAGHWHGGKVYILVLDVLDVLDVLGVLGHFLTDISGAQEAGRLSSDWVADSRTFEVTAHSALSALAISWFVSRQVDVC